MRPATWAEALARIVAAIRHSQRGYGLPSVGCFGGGGLTNEKAYQLGEFARVALRTPHIDYNGRFCMSSAATAGNRAFGIDRRLPFPLADIAQARTVLVVGGNPADTMPPAMQYFDAGRATGAAHIVVAPRYSATARGSTHLPLHQHIFELATGCSRTGQPPPTARRPPPTGAPTADAPAGQLRSVIIHRSPLLSTGYPQPEVTIR